MTRPRLGSVCSGVGGMDMGLEAAGFELLWLCEKEETCRTVLTERWPGVHIYPDLEGLADYDPPAVQLLAGGTPCQDLSVAGRRAGLDGEKSGLFFEFIRLADQLAPDWILWENVDGALSSDNGEDFAVCLEGFTGFRPAVPADGWRSSGVCVGPRRWCVWRVLDAQYFGVAQRRARLFVVAGTGAEPRPEILLESESVSGDSAPSRTARQVTAAIPASGAGVSRTGNERTEADFVVAGTLDAGEWRGPNRNQIGTVITEGEEGYIPPVSPALKARDAKGQSSDGHNDGQPLVVVPALTSKMAKQSGGPSGDEVQNLVAHTLRAEGADASEDGTGRGVPLVTHALVGSKGGVKEDGTGRGMPIVVTQDSCPVVMDDISPALKIGTGLEKMSQPPAVLAVRTAQTSANGHGVSEEVAHTLDGASGQAVVSLPGEPEVYERHDQDARYKKVAVAPTLGVQADNGCDLPMVLAYDTRQVTSKDNRSNPKPGDPCHPVTAKGADAPLIVEPQAFAMRGREAGAVPEVSPDGRVSALRGASGGSSRDMVTAPLAAAVAPTLGANNYKPTKSASGAQLDLIVGTAPDPIALQTDVTPKAGELAFTLKQPSPSGGGQPAAVFAPVAPTMRANGDANSGFRDTEGLVGVVPRRLTPRECERLMGWPDDWTLVKGLKDSPRYRMIGNGVVSSVAEWIGRRILEEPCPPR